MEIIYRQILKKLKPRIADEALCQLIRNRGKAGAEILYDTYAGCLSLAIFRIVKQRYITGQVLEKTFRQIWFSIDDYMIEQESLYTWMTGIARKLAREGLYNTTTNYEN